MLEKRIYQRTEFKWDHLNNFYDLWDTKQTRSLNFCFNNQRRIITNNNFNNLSFVAPGTRKYSSCSSSLKALRCEAATKY